MEAQLIGTDDGGGCWVDRKGEKTRATEGEGEPSWLMYFHSGPSSLGKARISLVLPPDSHVEVPPELCAGETGTKEAGPCSMVPFPLLLFDQAALWVL